MKLKVRIRFICPFDYCAVRYGSHSKTKLTKSISITREIINKEGHNFVRSKT